MDIEFNEYRKTKVSKTLSKLLRHTGKKKSLKFRAKDDGYIELVKITDHLATYSSLEWFRQLSNNDRFDIIRQTVETNKKKRFSLLEENGTTYIRANQGHTMVFANFEASMTQITLENYQDVLNGPPVHGTYYDVMDPIRQEGLKKMGRNHVHFSNGFPDYISNNRRNNIGNADASIKSRKIVSGMRKNCQVAIILDTVKALEAGMEIYLSVNDVVLTAGFDGIIPPEFFGKIIDIRSGKDL